MSKQRFEAPTLDLAVQAARDALGESARIVGATKVRRGGVGGFFAREHVEVEAELSSAKGARPSGPDPSPPGAPATAAPRNQAAPTGRPVAGGHPAALGHTTALGPALPEDALSDLIEEMAQSGPSSVLDLAERVNNEQARFALSEDNTPMGDMIGAVRSSGDFAEMLQRIAAEAGLLGGEAPEPDLGIQVHHNDAILTDFPPPQGSAAPLPERPSALGTVPGPAALGALAAPAEPGTAPAVQPVPASTTGHGLARQDALRQLGLPVRALPASLAFGSVERFESDLRAALEAALPPLPTLPRNAASVIAVVGERKDLLGTAKALAGEVGTPVEEIALATKRGVWRQQQEVIGSPEAASERRRGWRWRERPAVVAIETSVHPGGDAWVTSVLRALEPTLCVGVVEATRKPEDVAAWSQALGGLDALAITDLDATTSPAALLAVPVPVARADGQPATAAFWARQLCARLA